MSQVSILIIFSLLLISSNLSASNAFSENEELDIEQRTKFDDDLREIVEYLRLQMQCGFPERGIPPLAPYHNNFVEFDLQKLEWNLKGNLTDLIVTGLNEFDLVVLHWNNVLHRITYEFNFPSLQFHSSYQLNGFTKMFGSPLNIFGNGLFRLELINLRLKGSFRLRPSLSGGLAVANFKSQLEVEAVRSRSTGFMNNLIYTKLFNAWLEEFIYLTFGEQEEVSKAIEYKAKPFLNDLFKEVSLVELVAVITGLVDVGLPMEVNCKEN